VIDVFDSDLNLPKAVYILGSGIRGKEHHKRIPDDAYVIALNKSIMARPCNLWMLFARGYRNYEWWKRKAADSGILKLWGIHLITRLRAQWSREHRFKNRQKLNETPWKVNYSFEYFPTFDDEPYQQFIDGVLRTGATIGGAALQLCYWWDVEHVILCGIDMLGHTHFDGTVGSLRGKMNIDGEAKWPDCERFNSMIRLCEKKGMTIQSLSETKLRVERI